MSKFKHFFDKTETYNNWLYIAKEVFYKNKYRSENIAISRDKPYPKDSRNISYNIGGQINFSIVYSSLHSQQFHSLCSNY